LGQYPGKHTGEFDLGFTEIHILRALVLMFLAFDLVVRHLAPPEFKWETENEKIGLGSQRTFRMFWVVMEAALVRNGVGPSVIAELPRSIQR
jgi:hypothetical protein